MKTPVIMGAGTIAEREWLGTMPESIRAELRAGRPVQLVAEGLDLTLIRTRTLDRLKAAIAAVLLGRPGVMFGPQEPESN